MIRYVKCNNEVIKELSKLAVESGVLKNTSSQEGE